MKDIEWIGETRMIPNYGIGVKGENKTLPDEMAYSFIKQGLAIDAKSKKQTVKKESE